MGILKLLLKDPLLHFVITGFALYAAVDALNVEHQTRSDHQIAISQARVDQLANLYRQQFGRTPDPASLEKIVQSDIEEEILMREALKLNLDETDEVVRRRLVQKMRFLIEDLNAPSEPDDSQLQQYLLDHASRYEIPARVSFHHVYFMDKGDSDGGRKRARAALTILKRGAGPESGLGDPFPDRYNFRDYSIEQVQRILGQSPAADALFTAPAGQWVGPLQSGYGWHLFHVDARTSARMPELVEVRDRVQVDFMADARERLNEQAFQHLASNYQVMGVGEVRQ